MPQAQITPPTINASVDYSSGVDERGVTLVQARRVEAYPSAGAVDVKEGDLVSFGTPTSALPVSVHPTDDDTAFDEYLLAGIALNDADASENEIVRVADIHYVRIADGATPTIGHALPISTTAGQAGTSTATVALTHTVFCLGSAIADFYGAGEDAALAFVRR